MEEENPSKEKISFPFDWEEPLFRGAKTIVEVLRRNGHDAVFAGGCVRDMIMKVKPQDVDVATDAPPGRVRELFRRTIPVGEAFGVVIVRVGGIGYEVATFRREGQYKDGRRPGAVAFVGKEEDVTRRDFTCNGLLYDPLSETVLDFVQGRQDIERKLLRAIGDPRERFQEDHLRLIRAVRFAVQLDFQIEKETWEAIVEGAREIDGVSAERVKDELFKLFPLRGSGRGLRLLWESGLAPQLLPEAFPGNEAPSRLEEMCEILDLLGERSPEQAFAAILHLGSVPLDALGSALARLRLSNREAGRILEILQILALLPQLSTRPLRARKRAIRRNCFPEALDLFRSIEEASGRDLRVWERIEREAASMGREDLFPPRLLGGNDLLAMGFDEGRMIGELLQRLEDEQLEGRIRSKEEAARWAREQHG